MTERLVSQAFEMQRFTRSPRLQAVIDRSHARVAARELSDDELDYVAAAGTRERADQPDELLDAVAGGVTQDEFYCAWFEREWELEQEWKIDMWDFEGQKRAQDQAWDDVVNMLGMPD